ncbi:MAG: GDP-mannose 4,6-dehydratase [Elusimicrobia bacterium]|nr:GDP-mannose 4,6-dehydratase [Elusimicrobiota bacterium]
MPFWNNSSVLVTGAHGFTGSHLCRELLRAGAKVKAFVKKNSNLTNLNDIINNISIFYGDVTDLNSLEHAMSGVEYVFNPAAVVPVMEARKFPQKTFEVNSIGPFNTASVASKMKVKKILHISTCHIYGNLPESELPIKESAIPKPGDIYAASKYAAEIYLRPLVEEGAPIVFSRAFAKYGPGQGPHFLIPRIIDQLLKGETPQLGSPKPTRDYSHIEDIVKGYMMILEKGIPGEIYHLSSEKEMSVEEVFDMISKLLNVNTKPVWDPRLRPQDILRLYGNSSKARKQLGWKPEIDLKDGLKQTIDWWKKKRGS